MQPTDRLGQPLSVGDWVRVCESATEAKYAGEIFPIIRFENDHRNGELSAALDIIDGCCSVIAPFDRLTKINPKPKTTTWDKCVFVPEGVGV